MEAGRQLSSQRSESGSLGQHVVQFEEIDDSLPAIREGIVEAARDDIHRFARCGHLISSIAADSSTSASADASSGSMNPAE